MELFVNPTAETGFRSTQASLIIYVTRKSAMKNKSLMQKKSCEETN